VGAGAGVGVGMGMGTDHGGSDEQRRRRREDALPVQLVPRWERKRQLTHISNTVDSCEVTAPVVVRVRVQACMQVCMGRRGELHSTVKHRRAKSA
jgi:hypothetical protein